MHKLISLILTVAIMVVACSSAEEPTDSAESTEATATTAPAASTDTPEPAPTEAEPTPVEPTATAEPEESTAVPEPTATEADMVEPTASPPSSFKLEAWADNWFAAYLDDTLIVEDSVPITTERSFNAETATFEAAYPLHLNVILKDFKENDTGLEYIGERNQQMGDGGFILQLTDTNSGEVVAVTNGDWACMVINEAPLDKSCESESNPVAGTAPCDFIDLAEPDGWKSAEFDDSGWTDTTVHSAADVDPKIGYDEISWDPSAELIWGPDLETDNTILCRVTITGN